MFLFPPHSESSVYQTDVIHEILQQKIRKRPDRHSPRAVKRKTISNYPAVHRPERKRLTYTMEVTMTLT